MEFQSIVIGLLLLISSLQVQLQKAEVEVIKDSIMQCESGGNPLAINTDDAKITGSPSFGLYQFQPLTFLKYGIKYKIFSEKTTLKEAMKYIKNPAYNAAVANAMIDDGLAPQHWVNCYSKLR